MPQQKSVTTRVPQMKRKSASKRRPSWIEKLDAAGQQFVLGYRLTKQFDRKCSNPTERHKFMNLVRSYLPGFVPKEETDIPPAALDSLKSVGFPVWTNVTAGKQLLPVSVDLPPFFAHGIIRHFLHSGLRLRTAEPVTRSRPAPPSSLSQ